MQQKEAGSVKWSDYGGKLIADVGMFQPKWLITEGLPQETDRRGN